MTTNGTRLDVHQLAAKNGYPRPEENHGHTCTQCGAPVECEWKVILETRRHARQQILAANLLELKLAGVKLGRPRRQTFTTEEARELLAKLGNINRVRLALGVGHETVKRALNGDGGGT